jgi:hypothetical protein
MYSFPLLHHTDLFILVPLSFIFVLQKLSPSVCFSLLFGTYTEAYIQLVRAGYRVVRQSLIRSLEMGFQYMKSFRFLFAGMLSGHIKCQLA